MRRDCTLELLGPCNYRCWYCVGDTPGPRFEQPVLHDLDRLRGYLSAIKDDEVYTTVYARGTEPCLHPQMIEIAQICSPLGTVQIATNLSQPVEEWLSGPKNIFLLVTLHPEAEKDVSGFMERVRSAIEQGYRVKVQVLGRETEKDRPWLEWQDMVHAVGVTEIFKVHWIRDSSTVRAESARLPIPEVGALCSGGYSSFRVAYNDPSHPISGSTTLYRCHICNLKISHLSDKLEPCPNPYADKRCYMGLGRELLC